jgi:ubiquinone/menaquinone biosynthesis C-methylase UbiE
VTWRLFEREAERYESWYETARGRRASSGEKHLLGRFLGAFPSARSVLDLGCGTGHFTTWLAQRGLAPIGLDRSPAMLAVLRRSLPQCPVLVADAHSLPLRDRAVDLALFVTTLEFLEDPRLALSEATRVARQGVLVLALNRCSVGALSRRFGPASRGALLPHARDLSPSALRRLMAQAGGARLRRLHSGSAVLPRPLPAWSTPLPFGDIVGVAAELRCE